MTSKEIEQLLIDYAEGILSAEQKEHVEKLLRDSHDLQEEFAAIQNAFQALQTLPNETVPEHYFTNFLPRLRQNIETMEHRPGWFVPRWVESMIIPVVSLIILVAFGVLFQLLQPSEAQSPMYSVVKEIEQNDLNVVVEEFEKYEIFNGSIQNAEQSLDRFSHADDVSQKISNDFFSVELLAAHMESDWVELLEEPEIDLVLNRLREPEIQ